jgi:tetratricopeptide (TPR) repeat protein
VEQFVRHTLERAGEVGNRRALSLCYHALGAVRYQRGEFHDSVAALRRSIELAVSFGGTFGEVLGEQRLALAETALGRYQPAYERLRRALAVARASENVMVQWHSVGRILTTLARNRYEAGDLTAGADYLAQGFANQQEIGECPGCDVLLYPVAVPIYLALGQRDDAERACRLAEATALHFRSQAWKAAARHARGLVAGTCGLWPAAAGQLLAARDLFQTLGQPYDLARSLEALAGVARRAGPALPNLDAADLLQQARTIYAQLDAAGDLGRLTAAEREPVA